ncbi:MAG TPA: MBL fold metallo-hydrolase [Solirubrobacterales bacterium]|nr:MBL fold metallo-hydrolase [Solirubrobacterales bacterium]
MSREPTPTEAITVADLDECLLRAIDRDLDEVRVHHLADGVCCLQLTLPYARPKSVNAVLLDTEDGKLLVDCGNLIGLGWPGLERALALAGSSPDQVATLFLTHLHPDHAEMAPTFVERTGARLLRGEGPDTVTDLMHERTVPLADRRELARRSGVPDEHLRLMVDETVADHGTVAQRPADAELGEGDALATRFGTWELIPAKGHSANQYVLYERRRRWLIGGDIAYAGGRPFVEWGHTADPYGDHLESIERIGELPVDLFIPGHGPPDPDPAERFHASREGTLQWGRGALEALAADPVSAYEIALSMVGDNPDPDVRQSALSSILAALDHLVEAGSVTKDESGEATLYELTAAGRAAGEPG